MADKPIDEKEVFNSARQIAAPEERLAYLQKACGHDPAAMHRVLELLRVYDQERSFLESSPVAHGATIDEPVAERPGTAIGPYKLLEQIGEGGFGVVFMAEQNQPVRRKVALKILKPGMDTRQVVARFEAERQALAIMDHPNIAKVLDGGQTTGGRPYFVMDLVKGLPITEYCDQAQLTPRERLELFVQVCQAVQHAHQKGVIHRDLKPSNVLVMVHDTTPVVKVIDFGVAKALGQELTDKTLFTGFAQMVGTPLYMSPEQAGQSGVDVDTRSDIYSLGVLLYELLTGTTPFDKERLKELGYDELRRIIREEEPPKPSTRISTLDQASTTIAAQRKSDPKKLSHLFRGELDWIVMKCLEKDRNRRYETPSALAADVQRYLHDEPVQACPPSAWYRFRKFARRKKTTLAMATCVFLALAGIAGAVGWAIGDKGAREEGIQREQQAREKALDQSVAQTLDETGALIEQRKWPEALGVVDRADKLLAAADRTERPPRLLQLRRELTMAERLENIYREPERDLSPQVLLSGGEGTERRFQAKSHSSEAEFFLGRQQDARFAKEFKEFGIDIDVLDPAESAARIGRTTIRQALVKALDDWAPLRKRARGQNDPAWKKLVEIARLGDPDLWRNRCRGALLRADRQALELLADSVPIRQVPPATLWLLADHLMELGARDKAVALLRQAQREYPNDQWINDQLGYFCWTKFQPPLYDDALRFYSATLALRPGHPLVRGTMAKIWLAKGAVHEAVAEYSRLIQLQPTNPNDPEFRNYLADNHHSLAQILDQNKQPQEAIKEYRAAIAGWEKLAADFRDKPQFRVNTAWSYNRLAAALIAAKQLDQAAQAFRQAMNVWHNLHTDFGKHEYRSYWSWSQASLFEALAARARAIEKDATLSESDRREQAQALRTEARELVQDGIKRGVQTPSSLNSIAWRLATYADPANRDPLFAVELAKLAVQREPKQGRWWNTLGAAQYRARDWKAAVEALNKSMELREGGDGFDWFFRAMAHWQLGDKEQARKWYRAATHWMHKYAADNAELQRFRDEAAALLGATANNVRQPASGDGDLEIWTLVLEAQPDSVAARCRRADAYAARTEWSNAAADYARAFEAQGPANPFQWFQYVLLGLQLGDVEGYRNICSRMQERFGSSKVVEEVALLAHACVAAPNALSDGSRVLQLAKQRLALTPPPSVHHVWSVHVLGLALYRTGHYGKAVACLENGLKDHAGWEHNVLNWLVLAMAEQRLGHSARAKEHLGKADNWIARKLKATPKASGRFGPPDWVWRDWLMVQLFRREAGALIEAQAKKN